MAAGSKNKGEVIAIVFGDAARAHAARRTVRSLMRSHTLCVDDAAVVAHAADGRIAVHGRRRLALAGLVGGLAWGGVLGSLMFQPVAGLIAGGLSGLIVGALTHAGLDPAWLTRSARTLAPGEAALVLAVSHRQDDDALALAADGTGRIIRRAHRCAWGDTAEKKAAPA